MARVLHVINRFGTSGGAENQLYTNLRMFSNPDLEHEVAYIFRKDETDPLPDVPKHGLFPIGANPGRREIIRELDRFVSERRPDLIHCSLAEAALASRIVGWRRNIPVIESLVNISHEDVRVIDNPSVNPAKLAVHRLIDRITMRPVTRFHALTRAVARSWRDNVGIPSGKITVIPRGIDLGRFDVPSIGRAEVRASIGVDGDAPMLLNVARQEPQKGQRYLLEAIPLISRTHPDVVVVFAGREGNSTGQLRSIVDALGIERNVRFLGVRDDVPTLLSAADVFVFPSLFEGLGVSLLEAMAANAAVCAVSDADPFDEIIEPGVTGAMFRAGDAHELADTVSQLLDDPEARTRMAAAARKEIEEHYRIEDITKRLEQMYLDVLASSS